MAGLGTHGVFKLTGSEELGAVQGGANIDALLDKMSAREQGQTFRMDPKTEELAVVSGKHSIQVELDRLAQRDAGRGQTDPAMTFRMDPKTETLAVATGQQDINAALDARSADQNKQKTRTVVEDAHDKARATQLGIEGGGTATISAALREARQAAAPARDVASGRSEGTSHSRVNNSTDKGIGR